MTDRAGTGTDIDTPDMTEHQISTQTVFNGRTIRVDVDEVRLPDGETSRREVVRHRGSVCLVAVQDGHLYLARQFRYATGETLYELPAGTRDGDEDPEATARREIQEEIGFSAGRLTYLFQGYVSPGYTDELQWFYLAEDLQPATAETDADEFIDVVRMPLTEALRKIENAEFKDSKTIAGVLAAARRLGVS